MLLAARRPRKRQQTRPPLRSLSDAWSPGHDEGDSKAVSCAHEACEKHESLCYCADSKNCSVLCSTTPSHPFNSAPMCTGCSQQSRTGRRRWPPRAAPSRCRCARGSLARRSTAARRRERCSATNGGGSGGCTSSSGTSMPEGAQSGHVSMCAAPVDACCSSPSQIRRELTAIALGANRCRPRPRPPLCPENSAEIQPVAVDRPVRTVSGLPTPHP